MAVILAFRVGIYNGETNWGTGGFSFENSREKYHFIFLFSLGNYCRLSRFAALHFSLYRIKIQRNSSGATVNNSANCGTVRFAKSGKFKDFSEGIARHRLVFNKCKLSKSIIQNSKFKIID